MHKLNGIGYEVAFGSLVRQGDPCQYGSRFLFAKAKPTERKPQVVNGRLGGLINEETGFSFGMMNGIRGSLTQTFSPTKTYPHFVDTGFRQHGLPGNRVGSLVFGCRQVMSSQMARTHI